MKFRSINPCTEEVIEELDPLPYEEARAAAAAAAAAWKDWRRVPPAGRAELIGRVGEELMREQRRHAETITREMGKIIRESEAEVEKCAQLCGYYAANAETFLRPEHISTEAGKSYAAFEPLGVILGIMPWNFPYWQVMRFAVPALAAGNACLLKHASNVPRCSLEIEGVFARAGLPPRIFRSLLIDAGAADRLLEEDLVAGVSLTGSGRAGSKVGSLAGRNIRKLVLELGGSDPFIVLDDADADRAAETAAAARLLNGGQSCIAAKRFIVMEKAAPAFLEKFSAIFTGAKAGDPMETGTDLGPMAAREFVGELQAQLDDAAGKGARAVTAARAAGPVPGKGFFFTPVLLTNVTPGMKVWTEEVFGPIAPVMTARSEEEAVELANATSFGLGASIWSRDPARAERIASRIEAGFVAVNDMVKSDPRLPFGGVKKSGVGRELSHFGLREFTNVKTVVVNG